MTTMVAAEPLPQTANLGSHDLSFKSEQMHEVSL